MYLVSYKSATRPTDLPDGATVERIPREFPLTLDSGIQRKFTVSKMGSNAYLTVSETDSSRQRIYSNIPPEVTRELAHALLEAIGDGVPDEVPDTAPPAHVIDGDGDHWRLHSNGEYFCTGQYDREVKSYDTGEVTLESISRQYSGYRVVS